MLAGVKYPSAAAAAAAAVPEHLTAAGCSQLAVMFAPAARNQIKSHINDDRPA